MKINVVQFKFGLLPKQDRKVMKTNTWEIRSNNLAVKQIWTVDHV